MHTRYTAPEHPHSNRKQPCFAVHVETRRSGAVFLAKRDKIRPLNSHMTSRGRNIFPKVLCQIMLTSTPFRIRYKRLIEADFPQLPVQWLDGGCRPRAPFFIERRVLDKYEWEPLKNKGKIQEKVSLMKNQGDT